MTNALFTICGRAGSKGIAGKNVGSFLDVPLVYYTLASIELFKESNPSVEVTVALNTDSEQLKSLVEDSGLLFVAAERPSYLATDSASKVDVISDTLKQVEALNKRSFDVVVDLDITSPLRTASDIARVTEASIEGDADVVFTVAKSRRNPCFNMVVLGDDGYYHRVLPSNFTARQQAPEFFDMNASIYAYTPSFLRSGKQIFEGRCSVVEMRDTAVLDLDNPDDLELMQIIARWLIGKDPEFKNVDNMAKQLVNSQ